MISVVIPALDAASTLSATLAALSAEAAAAGVAEIVVADGGSRDDTVAVAEDRKSVV
jgi:glycosyltransferase involved in cell wall biosynthesis